MTFRPFARLAIAGVSLLCLAAATATGGAASGSAASARASAAHPWAYTPLNQLVAQHTTSVVLHFNGNPTEDASCTGDGDADITDDNCSNLKEGSGTLSSGAAAHWDPPSPALDGTNARNIYDPNWLWVLSTATTIQGQMTVDWWAACGLCTPPFTADWTIRIWTDANGQTGLTPSFEEVVTASPSAPNVPEKLTATVTLPMLTATSDFILHVDPVFADTQNLTHIYYDSTLPCPGLTSGPCDSTVTMPVASTAVRVADFTARSGAGGVELRWRTTSEQTTVGFNVWREGAGGKVKVNRSLIAATGRVTGASYRLTDRSARPGRSYAYRLELVGRGGERSSYGPVRVSRRR